MKILYLSSAEKPDYLCDMIFHGLRAKFGADVVDANRLWYMYAGEKNADPARHRALYGKGFSLYGLIDEGAVDRTDIHAKVRNHYYDLIVYGSIRRFQPFFAEVQEIYDRTDILMIDGEDVSHVADIIRRCGIYFKRELYQELRWVYPLQFCFPADRILTAPPAKTRLQAYIDPRDTSTYIYDEEADYYADYRRSCFGVTTKKGGWDCMRHYEMMANGAIPHFPDLADCPPLTMPFLPKYEIFAAAPLAAGPPDRPLPEQHAATYAALLERVMTVMRRRLTTEAMADYMLRVRSQIKSAPDVL